MNFKSALVVMVISVCFASLSASAMETDESAIWKENSFKGHTEYKFIPEDDRFTLKAHCDGSASAYYKEIDVDLTKTPILQWSWKIDHVHKNLNGLKKSGDDYAARIYVVYKGTFPWDVKALDYVWANTQEKGTIWENAFTSKAIMIAQQSGTAESKDIWINETRNVAQDFQKYFNTNVKRITGVAVMTDCDNAGGNTTGYYRDIRFTASPDLTK